MTPPFKPGDRVTVRYNKPLGVLVVNGWHQHADDTWTIYAMGDGFKFAGPATSLIKVEDEAGREA